MGWGTSLSNPEPLSPDYIIRLRSEITPSFSPLPTCPASERMQGRRHPISSLWPRPLTQEMSCFPHSFLRLSPVPSSVTGISTAQAKPALSLWIIFLCQLKKKERRKNRGWGSYSGSPWKRIKNRGIKRPCQRPQRTGWSEKFCKFGAHVSGRGSPNKQMPCLMGIS